MHTLGNLADKAGNVSVGSRQVLVYIALLLVLPSQLTSKKGNIGFIIIKCRFLLYWTPLKLTHLLKVHKM